MKKLCMLLAALMALTIAVPALAEDESAVMTEVLLGDWIHEESSEYYLLFDGENKFCYETDGSFSYGLYFYQGNGEYRLIDDLGEERLLSIYDDMSLELEGIEGYFYCGYRYWLMDYPNTNEGTWLNDDGETTLLFDLNGDFELENEDTFCFGVYEYLGGGDYQMLDDEGNTRTFSIYENDSISVEGFDGYFYLQDETTGADPFEDVKDDAEFFDGLLSVVTPFDRDPIPLSGVWYKNGDDTTMPFVLNENTYSCENSVFGNQVSGTWTLDELIVCLSDDVETDPAAYLNMEQDDGMPSGWNPILMAGNRLLYSNATDTYFLHESLIGTEEGALLSRMADFMRVNWLHTDEDETIYLEFSCMDGAVICTTIDADDESHQEIVGNWKLEDNCIVANYADDFTETYMLPSETIVVAGLEFVQ